MEQVRRSLQEFEEKANEVKKVLSNKSVKMALERTKADIRKMQHQQETEKQISVDRAFLDKEKEKELSNFARRIEKEQVAHLKKALYDQHALFASMIARDRAITNEVLRKTREENDENIKKQQETNDSFNDQARKQVEELENHSSKLKGLIAQHVCEVPDDMICMPRWYFNIAVDNYCAPHVAMKFMVFKLEELYSDLEKYDLRADLGEFGIVGTSVKFNKFMRALRYHGYILDAEVYYLNPAPGSGPSTDLVKIVGQDDVKRMERAHAEQGTKICLLYLVRRYEDQYPDDVMIDPSECNEEADDTSKTAVVQNTTEGIRQFGDEGQLSGRGDHPGGSPEGERDLLF